MVSVWAIKKQRVSQFTSQKPAYLNTGYHRLSSVKRLRVFLIPGRDAGLTQVTPYYVVRPLTVRRNPLIKLPGEETLLNIQLKNSCNDDDIRWYLLPTCLLFETLPLALNISPSFWITPLKLKDHFASENIFTPYMKCLHFLKSLHFVKY